MFKKFINRLLIISTVIISGIFSSAFAQSPDIQWTRSFGGTDYDFGFSVKQTSDGGFVIAGSTESNGAGDKDVWLIRTDSSGNALWTKTIGGVDLDAGASVWQNTDGGFIITGQSRSFPADSVDILLIRTDASGNLIWMKNYGGPGFQLGTCVQQTLNGGFVVAGYTIIDSLYHSNAILLNVNGAGNNAQFLEFDRGDYDYAYSVIQTNTGGYAFSGRTALSNIQYDAWLVCIDGSGNILCDKTYGGSESEYGDALIQTYDDGFAIAGTTYSFGAGGADFLLIRTDASGDTIWTKNFGGASVELGSSVCQTLDSGYVITGYSDTFSSGDRDIWIVRTNSNGDTIWTKTIGESFTEQGYSVQATADGGFIITGYTDSDGAADVYLVKINSEATIPVELISFTAAVSEGNVNLNWITATELNNSGFEIERKQVFSSPSAVHNEEWLSIGFINGNGTSSEVHNYSYKDQNPLAGTSYYRLKQIDFDGTCSYSNEVEIEVLSPKEFTLYQNYPNPFNPNTKISWQSPVKGNQSLKVYDVLGNEVATIVNEYKEAGNYEINFDANFLSSGIYFYKLRVDSFVETKKMILMK